MERLRAATLSVQYRSTSRRSSLVENRGCLLAKGKGLAVVSILGKGGKTRRCPLWDDTCKALRGIIADRFSEEHVSLIANICR